MQKYFEKLKGVPLFRDINEDELLDLLGCLNARVRGYKKGEVILLAGDEICDVGIVLRGSIEIVREDYLGNKNILARVGERGLFAEVFATAAVKESPVTVMAETDAKIMFVDIARMLTTCSRSCAFHGRLIRNLLRIVAEKNLELQDKVECLGNRNIREKVTAFLNRQQKRAGTNPFVIPFSRAQMADYLCVNRSALSAVLCSMRDEGLIRFNRNVFEILTPEDR